MFNSARKNTLNDSIKKFKKLATGGNVSEASKILSSVEQAIDKASKTGLIKNNTASRKKSRLQALLKRTLVTDK